MSHSHSRYGKIGISGTSGKHGASDAYMKTYEIPIALVSETTTQTTAYKMPEKSVIEAAFINVITPETTGTTPTIDIGLSTGATDDIISGQSVTNAGLFPLSGGITSSSGYVTYNLGSDDFAELEAEIVIRVTAVKGG